MAFTVTSLRPADLPFPAQNPSATSGHLLTVAHTHVHTVTSPGLGAPDSDPAARPASLLPQPWAPCLHPAPLTSVPSPALLSQPRILPEPCSTGPKFSPAGSLPRFLREREFPTLDPHNPGLAPRPPTPHCWCLFRDSSVPVPSGSRKLLRGRSWSAFPVCPQQRHRAEPRDLGWGWGLMESVGEQKEAREQWAQQAARLSCPQDSHSLVGSLRWCGGPESA